MSRYDIALGRPPREPFSLIAYPANLGALPAEFTATFELENKHVLDNWAKALGIERKQCSICGGTNCTHLRPIDLIDLIHRARKNNHRQSPLDSSVSQ